MFLEACVVVHLQLIFGEFSWCRVSNLILSQLHMVLLYKSDLQPEPWQSGLFFWFLWVKPLFELCWLKQFLVFVSFCQLKPCFLICFCLFSLLYQLCIFFFQINIVFFSKLTLFCSIIGLSRLEIRSQSFKLRFEIYFQKSSSVFDMFPNNTLSLRLIFEETLTLVDFGFLFMSVLCLITLVLFFLSLYIAVDNILVLVLQFSFFYLKQTLNTWSQCSLVFLWQLLFEISVLLSLVDFLFVSDSVFSTHLATGSCFYIFHLWSIITSVSKNWNIV